MEIKYSLDPDGLTARLEVGGGTCNICEGDEDLVYIGERDENLMHIGVMTDIGQDNLIYASGGRKESSGERDENILYIDPRDPRDPKIRDPEPDELDDYSLRIGHQE